MRFMMIVKASNDSEAGKLPSEELLAAMDKYNKELMNAGILVDLAGLHPSSKGVRVRFADGKTTVIDGPFAETKELIGGYWIIRVNSRDEAIAWARRIPPPNGPDQACEVELRQFFELEDFLPSEAVEGAREFEKELPAKK
jgi:hypothetical protein